MSATADLTKPAFLIFFEREQFEAMLQYSDLGVALTAITQEFLPLLQEKDAEVIMVKRTELYELWPANV